MRTNEANCCKRCGQSLALSDDSWAEDRSIIWPKIGELCLQCYHEMLERNT